MPSLSQLKRERMLAFLQKTTIPVVHGPASIFRGWQMRPGDRTYIMISLTRQQVIVILPILIVVGQKAGKL